MKGEDKCIKFKVRQGSCQQTFQVILKLMTTDEFTSSHLDPFQKTAIHL